MDFADSSTQDNMHFIFNITIFAAAGMAVRETELMRFLVHVTWTSCRNILAFFVVAKRALIEPYFHGLYSSLRFRR